MPTPPLLARAHGRVRQWAALGLLLLAQSITFASTSDTSAPATPAAVSFNSERQILTVSTIDKQWDLLLNPKRLIGNAGNVENAILGLPQFFDGHVDGDTDSWVRITLDDTADESLFTGHVFTRGELFELQYREDMGGHALSPQPGSLLLDDMILPDVTAPGENSDDETNATDRSKLTDLTGKEAPTRAIKIGIAIDSSYNDQYDQRGLAQALSIINGVDGLYQEQLGLAVIVDGFRVYDDPDTDPLRDYPGNVDQILESYRDLRSQDEELPADLALVHLFSGHPDPDKIVGLGWIDTVCRLDGYDLSMSTPFPYGMLLAAHEIAHNLGAEHDDDAACSADESISGSEIMWSELSGNTRPSFSNCSLQSMRPALTSECVLDNIDVGVEISAAPTEQAAQLTFTVAAYNHDSNRIASQVTSTTEFPRGTQLSAASAACNIEENRLTCRHNALQPGGGDAISVTADFLNDGATYPLVVSELSPGSFTDTQLLDNQASLQLDDPQLNLHTLTFADAGNDPASLPASGGTTSQDTGSLSGGSAGAGSTGPFSLMLMALFGLPAVVRRPNLQA